MSFSFVHEGIEVRVHTVVGDGVTHTVWEELQPAEPDMEPQEDSCAA